MRPTHQDLSNDTTFSQIKSRSHVPLREEIVDVCLYPDGGEPGSWGYSVEEVLREVQHLQVDEAGEGLRVEAVPAQEAAGQPQFAQRAGR